MNNTIKERLRKMNGGIFELHRLTRINLLKLYFGVFNPETFTILEAMSIKKTLKLSDDEFSNIFLGGLNGENNSKFNK